MSLGSSRGSILEGEGEGDGDLMGVMEPRPEMEMACLGIGEVLESGDERMGRINV